MTDTKPRSKLTSEDYEKLGREVEEVMIKDYIVFLHSTPKQIWSSLVRGIFAGLGGVLGATVGVALLVFILQYFGGLPLVGEFLKHLSESIRQG